jgi:hypothetical protein
MLIVAQSAVVMVPKKYTWKKWPREGRFEYQTPFISPDELKKREKTDDEKKQISSGKSKGRRDHV